MFNVKKNYVLGIVFDSELKEVMLLKRSKEPYIDTINGIGGKVEGDEQLVQAIKREMLEETDIEFNNVEKIDYLVTLYYPNGVLLNVFCIVLNQSYIKKEILNTEEGTLKWYDILKDNLLDVRKENVAGEGNVAFFINYVLCREGKL